jgi:hypothetical protein
MPAAKRSKQRDRRIVMTTVRRPDPDESEGHPKGPQESIFPGAWAGVIFVALLAIIVVGLIVLI